MAVFFTGQVVDGVVASLGRWGIDVVAGNQVVRVDPWRVCAGLYPGAKVRVRLLKRRRDGLWAGSDVESALPAVSNLDVRPRAFIDEANCSGFGEPADISMWSLGAIKTFTLGLLLDSAGWRPEFIADSKNRNAFHNPPPSKVAFGLICRCPRWHQAEAPHVSRRNNADREMLTRLREELRNGREAIIVSTDKFRDTDDDCLSVDFPELIYGDFAPYIHSPDIKGDLISIRTLNLSMRIPLELFQYLAS